MSSFNKFFQEEVRRLARKEVKSVTDKLQSDVASLKKVNAELRRRLADLERTGKRLKKVATKVEDTVLQPEQTEIASARFTGKTIRAMRRKLGVTQAEFGLLAGVTGQSVYQWERRDDQILVRGAARENLVAMKKMGRRQAQARLEELQ